VGLLLPLPLVLLLGSVMHQKPGVQNSQGGRVSPVLDVEERMRRVTYRRACQSSSDCEPPLGCLEDLRVGADYCTDSQCMTDLQCPEGQVCQSLATLDEGPLVRLCVPLGVREEGQRCFSLPNDREAACAPGLLCGGHEGWCARPCRQGEVESCPEGFFCADVGPRPVCMPTCEARGCPEGQQCVRFKEGVSACARVHGPNCQQSPCPEGRECKVLTATQHPGRVWMECIERCGAGHPSCSEGLVCDGWHCLPPCSPQEPGSCPEGYRCIQRRPDRPWACQPDW
jgi:hypothetical protein